MLLEKKKKIDDSIAYHSKSKSSTLWHHFYFCPKKLSHFGPVIKYVVMINEIFNSLAYNVTAIHIRNNF